MHVRKENGLLADFRIIRPQEEVAPFALGFLAGVNYFSVSIHRLRYRQLELLTPFPLVFTRLFGLEVGCGEARIAVAVPDVVDQASVQRHHLAGRAGRTVPLILGHHVVVMDDGMVMVDVA